MEEVSVLIPTHNRAGLIGETLRCVLAQSFQNFEIIVVDDGSTDNTEEVVRSFNDPRIHYFKYERIGRLTKLRNIAVSKSTKPFLAFIDSDDLWHPEKLELCLRACTEQNASVCVADCIEFKGTAFNKQSRAHLLTGQQNIDIKREILINNLPLTYGTNIFLRKSAYEQVGGFDETMFHGDHDFLCRSLYVCSNTYIPNVLSYIRRHDSNMSLNENNHDLRPLMEYNATLKKITAQHGITKQELKTLSARNHYILAKHALDNSEYRISFANFRVAFVLKPRLKKIPGYFKNILLHMFKNQS